MDEVWRRRQATRAAAVEAVKCTPKYNCCLADPYRPPSPDPIARIPKREWERRMAEWRQALRERSIVTIMLADLFP
jgi:hypothetical protein